MHRPWPGCQVPSAFSFCLCAAWGGNMCRYTYYEDAYNYSYTCTPPSSCSAFRGCFWTMLIFWIGATIPCYMMCCCTPSPNGVDVPAKHDNQVRALLMQSCRRFLSNFTFRCSLPLHLIDAMLLDVCIHPWKGCACPNARNFFGEHVCALSSHSQNCICHVNLTVLLNDLAVTEKCLSSHKRNKV
jgi:hypothetical protein